MTDVVTEDHAAQPPLIHRLCPICADPNEGTPTSRYARDDWRLVNCRVCDFPYLASVPATERLVEELAWEKTFVEERKARHRRYPLLAWLDARTRWRLRLFPRPSETALLKRVAPRGPVIDIGCGPGNYLAELADTFAPLHGVEISREHAAIAQQRIGEAGTVCHAPAIEGLKSFPDNYFAGALLRSYLEHEWQARDVLDTLRRKLRREARVVVKIPNYGSLNRIVMGRAWCGFRFPDHVNYFTRRSLVQLIEPIGYCASFPSMRNLPTDDNLIAILSLNACSPRD